MLKVVVEESRFTIGNRGKMSNLSLWILRPDRGLGKKLMAMRIRHMAIDIMQLAIDSGNVLRLGLRLVQLIN
jgi:hypothetical protein